MKKVVVFGGSGFLGSYVADELTRRGYDVVIADLKESRYLDNGQTYFACDIMDPAAVATATKEEIYRDADIITLHTPLTDLTHHLINHETLAQMKPTAFVINTARGPIIDGDALKQALIEGVIAGAALDVYESEPPEDRELLGLPNLFCTPHIGGNADEAVMAMGLSAIHHLKEFFGK